MNSPLRLILLPLLLLPSAAAAANPIELASPGGELKVTVDPEDLSFVVSSKDADVVTGSLGMVFAEGGPFGENLKLDDWSQSTVYQTYEISVGKTSSARNHYKELLLFLEETVPPRRKLDIAFRAFDDGVAFRYRIPEQEAIEAFVLTDERTALSFPGDPVAYVLPLNSYTGPYEKYYDSLKTSAIPTEALVGLPMLVEPAKEGGPWIAVTEANLTDYAGLYLSGTEGASPTLTGKLSPLPGRSDGAKVIGEAPHNSPWRVLMIGDNPGRLLESNIVFNLSDPPKIKDTSWIKPGKTTFPWWNGYALGDVDFKSGVNTATMKHYIDFCAEQGIPYHSLDGLDIAWYGGPIGPAGPTDVTTGAESMDIPEILRYAKEKGVRIRLWMHWLALKPQIDEAFKTYEEWGIEGVMVDFMDRDDQEMVNFYHEMAEKAAKHHLTVTLHGAYKPTGMERTWPNVLSYEAALNQEYNKWQPHWVRGTPPEHNLDIAFVRGLAGPIDYHQGGMRSVLPENYQFRDKAPPVQGTRGHQLAMYVVYQNHLSMMADYPAAYRGEPGLEFLVDVPANWDETRVLVAEMRKCIVIARRKSDTWYLGGMTATEARSLQLPLDFLGAGEYRLELYKDKPEEGPNALAISESRVSADQRLKVTIPKSGGFVAILKPKAKITASTVREKARPCIKLTYRGRFDK